jgi:hypothetical protein
MQLVEIQHFHDEDAPHLLNLFRLKPTFWLGDVMCVTQENIHPSSLSQDDNL